MPQIIGVLKIQPASDLKSQRFEALHGLSCNAYPYSQQMKRDDSGCNVLGALPIQFKRDLHCDILKIFAGDFAIWGI